MFLAINSVTILIHQEEVRGIEVEVHLILWVMVDTLIDLVDVVVPMVPQIVVMVVPVKILKEVVQIVLSPLNFKEGIGMTDILNMINLNRV